MFRLNTARWLAVNPPTLNFRPMGLSENSRWEIERKALQKWNRRKFEDFFSQRKFVWEKNLKMDDLDSNSQIMDSQFTRDENEIVKEICELFEVSIYILHSLL